MGLAHHSAGMVNQVNRYVFAMGFAQTVKGMSIRSIKFAIGLAHNWAGWVNDMCVSWDYPTTELGRSNRSIDKGLSWGKNTTELDGSIIQVNQYRFIMVLVHY